MFSAVLAVGGDLLDPEHLIDTVGLLGIFAVIFAESGLLIGFFLPGDSLLFTAGFLASAPSSVDEALHLPLGWLLVGCFVGAVAGDQVGYVFGRRVGPALFKRPDSRFFKQDNIDKAHEFFDRYGAKTIVLARFVPIVRTFAPIVAGVSQMKYRTFVTFNVVGGLLWAVGVTLLGYFLGQVDVVEENLEIAILTLVTISVLPIALELWKARREKRSAAIDVAHDLLDPGIDEMAAEALRPDGRLDGDAAADTAAAGGAAADVAGAAEDAEAPAGAEDANGAGGPGAVGTGGATQEGVSKGRLDPERR